MACCTAKSLLFICVTILISSANSKSLSFEDRRKIALHCLKVVGIDRKIVTDAIDTETIPRGGKYGDYLVCTYRLNGFLDATKSELKRDAIAAFMAETYKSSEVAFIMDGCKNIENAVPKELVLDALDCLTQQMKIAKGLRDAGYDNDIYTVDKNPFSFN